MKKVYSLFVALLASGVMMAQTFPVTFQVDMALQTVGADGVHIAGSFQQAAGFPADWTPGSTALSNGGSGTLYSVTVNLPAGTYEYKFINGNSWGNDEGVPASCATNGNRTVVVSAATTIPAVCFAQCVPCPAGPLPTYNITFQVDLENFCGSFDSITLAGTVTNWNEGMTMTQVGTSNVYEAVTTVDSGDYEYKFRFHLNGNTNWEGLPNRLGVASANATVPAVCFNSTTPCSPKPADSDITFRVDFTQSSETPADSIFVMGDFTSPAWQDGRLHMPMVSPGVYEVTFTGMCPQTFFYKFVNGGLAAGLPEESFADTTQRACVEPNGIGGWNRVHTRTTANPITLGYVYNTCQSLVSVKEFTQNTFNVFPNPSLDGFTVKLGDKNYGLQLIDITGKTVYSASQATGNFQVERGNLKAGFYILNVIDAQGNISANKVSIR